MNKETTRAALLLLALAAIAGGIYYLESLKPPALSDVQKSAAEIPVATSTASDPKAQDRIAAKEGQYPRAVDIVSPAGFINAAPFSLRGLVGTKVILIDFWTYSCINCIRTIPYLESWYEKYKDAGLVVVGIHTPEFDFEKNIDNVRQAVSRDGVTYPVVLDSNRTTWSAYENEYWPHEYLIDIDGFIVHDQIGEGGYQDTEAEIQKLLAERDTVLGLSTPIPQGYVSPKGMETVSSRQTSPETYFGSNRNVYFGNGVSGTPGTQNLKLPDAISPNLFYLGGTWDIEGEFAQNTSANAQLQYQYEAQNLYFVAAAASSTVPVKVFIDGKPIPASMRGADVDANGLLHIKENRLYKVVKDSAWGEHTLELVPQAPGLEAYTFTFG